MAPAAGGKGVAGAMPQHALGAVRAECRSAGVQAVDQLWVLDCVSHYLVLAARDYSWDSVNWEEEA